jgi:hypothetical protein
VVKIGAVLLVFGLVYAIPRTSILGVILLTGYLGGAVATQWRRISAAIPVAELPCDLCRFFHL